MFLKGVFVYVGTFQMNVERTCLDALHLTSFKRSPSTYDIMLTFDVLCVYSQYHVLFLPLEEM